jgi:RNA polymerase sigma-70 factor (ECF subfamily)
VQAVTNRVDDALRSLPDSFFKVVELVDLGEASYREAAESLGVPVGTVMSRLFRARRLLETALEAERPATTSAANAANAKEAPRAAA